MNRYFAFALFSMTSGLCAQTTTRATVAADGSAPDASCSQGSISADGRFVAFVSRATDLAPVDATPNDNVFVKDRATGDVTLESVTTGGLEADGPCFTPLLSSDGRWLAFASEAFDLVDGPASGRRDVYLRDRASGTTTRLSVSNDGNVTEDHCFLDAMSSDGRFVLFDSRARNLVAGGGGHSDLFLYDATDGSLAVVNRSADGPVPNDDSRRGDLSDDGRYIAFESAADNLVAGDTSDHTDIFLVDRALGTLVRVSVATDGTDPETDSFFPRLSSDGRFVTYQSQSHRLTTDDDDLFADAFVYDHADGSTRLASVGLPGSNPHDDAILPAISDDGRFVAFRSRADGFVEFHGSGHLDVYLRDCLLERNELVSIAADGSLGDGDCDQLSITPDGRVVAFDSLSSNLVGGDDANSEDVFVREWSRTAADFSTYGAGFPGKLGVPSFVPEDVPHLGATLALDVGNSSGLWTIGFMLVGAQSIDQPTNLGGDLLVAPLFLIAVPLPPSGYRLLAEVPLDDSLSGIPAFTQVLEMDPFAAHGVSFTAGLQLDLGY